MAGFYASQFRLPDGSGLVSPRMMPIRIDGSDLPNGTATTAGVDVGAGWCVARDDGANLVTITFNESVRQAPMVYASVSTANAVVDVITTSTTGITYTTVENDDTTSAVADADVDLFLLFFDTADVT